MSQTEPLPLPTSELEPHWRDMSRMPDDGEDAPPLKATLRPTPKAPGLLAAETVVENGGTGVLDIVVPADVAVIGWMGYARDRESHRWIPVDERLNEHGRRPIAVADTPLTVWGFHRSREHSNQDENVWRIYSHNAPADGGKDVCLRLVVALALVERLASALQKVAPMRRCTSAPKPPINRDPRRREPPVRRDPNPDYPPIGDPIPKREYALAG